LSVNCKEEGGEVRSDLGPIRGKILGCGLAQGVIQPVPAGAVNGSSNVWTFRITFDARRVLTLEKKGNQQKNVKDRRNEFN